MINSLTEKIEGMSKEIDTILNTYGKFLSEKQYAKFLQAKKILNEIFN